MIKCHLVTIGEIFESIGEGHACKDLINGYALGQMDCDNGYFLTDSDLKQLKKEYHNQGWQDAAKWYVEVDKRGTNFEEGLHIKKHLADYEQSKQQARKGEG